MIKRTRIRTYFKKRKSDIAERLQSEYNYTNDKKDGLCVRYFRNGNRRYLQKYENGKVAEETLFFNKNK